MARPMVISQQKLAEKLIILNDRGTGMLTRIYNIKKACADPKSKPSFLSDKTHESSMKHVVKKFPNIDIKSLQPIFHLRSEIIKSLSLYYYTFVDLLDFKDKVGELLTTIDACQLQLDIGLNFDLTKSYLDLVFTYVSLMVLLSRVDDRKAVLGLFNAAHEMSNEQHQSDPSFPRLGQLIIEYENPFKKLSDEFVPHSKVLVSALLSLQELYARRNLSAQHWRSAQMLSLIANQNQMLNPAQTNTMPCEYLSLDVMERWIVFGFTLCYPYLNQGAAQGMWSVALQSGWTTCLFRDEVIHIHGCLQSFFEGIKGQNKRAAEVKDYFNKALEVSTRVHRERRKFLRTALKELATILADQPGLLGPKALFVFMGLSLARDEVIWLVRHHDNLPSKQAQGKNKLVEDLVDRQLPELLFHMEELRALVRKYNQVLQRYYVQYLSGYDAVALDLELQPLQNLTEEESVILSAMCNTISTLNVRQVEEADLFDFRGMRIDWCRLQAYAADGKSTLNLMEHKGLAFLVNTIIFHTRMVDSLDEMLVETSDLSLFCFYSKHFEDHFHMCLEFPAQNRYIIAFPLICGHFQNCTHELCPEERHHIKERSLSVVNVFLDEMAKEAKNIITTICDEQCLMADRLLPKHCAAHIAQIHGKKKREVKPGKKQIPTELNKPGIESYRKTREDLTTMDKLHMALTELCFAINYCSTITIWDYTFAPREYLHQHLESRFSRALVGMSMFNPETGDIAKPSELLASVRAYMNVLQSIENYAHLDITRVFNSVLLQQTHHIDPNGDKTLAAHYVTWYSDILLRRVGAHHIIFSPIQRAFVTMNSEGSVPFNAEEFSDITELRSLAELIGPYGMKYLSESLLWQVASQVQEIRKLVLQNNDILVLLRSNFDKPDTMKELAKRLQGPDNVLQRMIIIGVILSFRQLCQEALSDVLSQRIPFLFASICDIKENGPKTEVESPAISELASAAGLPVKVEPALINSLRHQKQVDPKEDEHHLACLLLVFVAVSLPRLARMDASVYKANLGGHVNNAHCLAMSINTIFCALFAQAGRSDADDRLKEFLALASSSLLRLGQEIDREAVRNRDAIYILLDLIVQESSYLTMDLLESCFPYGLIRKAYQVVHKAEIVPLKSP
ncbi:membrane-associated protein Hem-like [Artemia franciscana]|uniref:Membrane-associated protein Hem n=1 Tax=Artemia franciscana TaxID=6661 RepID=A0AA88L8H9_ARTSF|nr:hypothetical protein QYM36_002834 [Artemia franciscana]KAK2722428.1 hypothetical protein QYM36_002834 [Artemia franciscana]KAK2722429.1 hypothetical protein QYM36_002834 [Artemia franciscana]